MTDFAIWIPLLPLIATLLIFFLGDWLPLKGAWIGILATLVSFGFSFHLISQMLDGALTLPTEMRYPWISLDTLNVSVGILLDSPAIWLLGVVTGVSALVQIYSVGYMHGAARFKLFFVYLNFFTFSMLALVVANNYLQFFVGWELMGLCSYLLISFEFERDAAGRAGNKAFLTTKLGDLGLYAGILMLLAQVGTLNFLQIQEHAQTGMIAGPVAGLIAILLFLGTVGKSAQFPLHGWLPDAMEGPTPVSALIHAATMVAAGVFLVVRAYPLFSLSPSAMDVVAWTGGITAFFAATMALTAEDIKKVLAYSTISQLGYMVLALGTSGYDAGLFHLITHAAFKALLFLAAGSVIHSVHTNNLWKMGALSRQMPYTSVTFMAGAFALAGFPWTSGFYSKDLILSSVLLHGNGVLLVLATLTVFMTAFYMTRACVLAFLGEPRDKTLFTQAHESPWTLTGPLLILALPSLSLGWWMHHHKLLEKFLVYAPLAPTQPVEWVSWMASIVSIVGIVSGLAVYSWRMLAPEDLYKVFRGAHKLFQERWYLDLVYDRVFVRSVNRLAVAFAWFDLNVLDRIFINGPAWLAVHCVEFRQNLELGMIDGVSKSSEASESGIWKRRSSSVQTYLLVMTLGLVLLIGYCVL